MRSRVCAARLPQLCTWWQPSRATRSTHGWPLPKPSPKAAQASQAGSQRSASKTLELTAGHPDFRPLRSAGCPAPAPAPAPGAAARLRLPAHAALQRQRPGLGGLELQESLSYGLPRGVADASPTIGSTGSGAAEAQRLGLMGERILYSFMVQTAVMCGLRGHVVPHWFVQRPRGAHPPTPPPTHAPVRPCMSRVARSPSSSPSRPSRPSKSPASISRRALAVCRQGSNAGRPHIRGYCPSA